MSKKNRKSNQVAPAKNEQGVDVEGIVEEALANAMFRVRLQNGALVLCTICGNMKIHNIRVLPEDRVLVGVKIYDVSKGRIKFRYK